ncbi:MAG: LCP family protein [Ilumatobacter sp.]|uniref:LCP family protein n=1 Tax=Ilumatobacter sp. TaxID=1967498 RepID=UPI003918ABDC
MAAEVPHDMTPPLAPVKLRRTWPQRLLVLAVSLAAVGSFAAAAAIWFVQQQLEDRNLVAIDSGTGSSGVSLSPGDATVSTAEPTPSADDETVATEPPAPVETFPPAEPAARNILVTGADNNSCLDPDSPYAAAFGNRDGFGERSDTIMMWRVNPATSQVAVLSFPRDLWVSIDGRSSKNRINTAYERDDPQRLINTIFQNFGIATDHYVQVDFCAFKTMVDAVNGVAVPFERSVRDVKTGLNVQIEGPSCFEFDGDHALAYVRSRSLQVIQDDGTWRTDPFSDLSRISRQQDFIRRVVDEAIANAFSPSVITGLLDTSKEFLVTDTGLTPNRVLQFAGVVRTVDPAAITTYQIQASGQTISGNSVLVPRLNGDNMQAVLALFRGEATLAERPIQDLDADLDGDDTPSATTVPLTTTQVEPDSAAPAVTDAATTTTEAMPFEPIPQVDAESDVVGYVPDGSISCT